MIDQLQAAIEEFELGGSIKPFEVEIEDSTRAQIVRFRGNPQRFVPRIFDGDWADRGKHPNPGSARVLRVMRGGDSVARAILRQGPHLYVYPMI